MNGSLYTWSNLNQYFASYLYHNGNKNVTPDQTSFLMPCIFMVQYCFMTVGVKLGDKVGPRFSTLIAVILMLISYAIMIFFSNFILVLVAMGIFGLGEGLGNISVIKNCWEYFPDNKGLVNGIIIGGLGLSSAILTPLADFVIINPEKKGPDGDLYPKEIADKLLIFLYILTGLFAFLGTVAVSFTFKYEKEAGSSEEIFSNGATLEIQDKDTLDGKANQNVMYQLFERFFSVANLFMIFFCFCGPCK